MTDDVFAGRRLIEACTRELGQQYSVDDFECGPDVDELPPRIMQRVLLKANEKLRQEMGACFTKSKLREVQRLVQHWEHTLLSSSVKQDAAVFSSGPTSEIPETWPAAISGRAARQKYQELRKQVVDAEAALKKTQQQRQATERELAMLAPLTEVMESLECAVFASDSEMTQEIKRTQQLVAKVHQLLQATPAVAKALKRALESTPEEAAAVELAPDVLKVIAATNHKRPRYIS